MIEIWKDVPGYEGLYLASNFGQIKSLPKYCNGRGGSLRFCRERILSTKSISKKGYRRVSLHKNSIQKYFEVHRLVALTFLKLVPGKYQVNHIDGDKLNNNLSNLEWVDNKENYLHSINLKMRGYNEFT